MSNSASRKYAAFISYSHADERVAKWLQRKLEAYKLPATIHNEFDDSRYLRPIFRDRSDLNGGVLADELRVHLKNSKFLIVICSPASAKSDWVNKEVQTFIEWGQIQYIIPFVVGGELNCNNENECLPYCLRELIKEHPDKELLCIDIREGSRNQAYIRVVSRILGLDFDELWHRYERSLFRKRVIVSSILLCLSFLFYWFGSTVALDVSISDSSTALPAVKNATITVGNTDYSIDSTNASINKMLPGYWRFRKIPISFRGVYFCPIDTVVRVGFSRRHTVQLDAKRDKTFAVFAGKIVDEEDQPIEGVQLFIDGVEKAVTDGEGCFFVEYPLHEQTLYKHIRLTKQGYRTLEREDECPGTNIIYKLRKCD